MKYFKVILDRREKNALHNINSRQKYPKSSENISVELIINVGTSWV